MKKEIYNSLKEKTETLSKLVNGGKGSGNFGHGGRPGKVGGSSHSGGFSKGQSVEVEYGGGKSKAKVLRKLSDKEKKDRAFLANPDAGDYYEVETDSGHKTIVWDAKMKDAGKSTKKDSKKSGDAPSKRELQIEGAQSRIKGLSDRIDALEKGMADDAKKGYTESHARDVEVLQDLKRQLTEANVDKLHYETGIDKEDLRDHEHRKGVIKEFKRGVENLQSRLDSQKRARDSYIKIGASKKEADEMYGDAIKDTEYALGRMKRRVLQTETMIKDMDHTIASRRKLYSK